MSNAQKIPEIGAQVWIEPGNTDQQIDHWFKILSENNFKVARLFIMWNYIETTPNKWDYTLYDKAFNAAKKYGVKIIATLTTNRRPPHRGDYYQLHATALEETQKRFNESKTYIEKVVSHYSNFESLDSWIVTNEAGIGAIPTPLAISRFRGWLNAKYQTIEKLNENWGTAFHNFSEIVYDTRWENRGYWNWKMPYMDWHIFYRKYLLWWMNEIKKEINKYDSVHQVQYHSQNVAGNLAMQSYEFHNWIKEADYIGLSCHPAWAFRLFEKNEFALGISYVNDLFYGASNPKPYIVTELQGGTNFQSGGAHPLTPSSNEIIQWLWASVGGGAQKVIFWLLNDRLRSFESTEWSMLDFQGNSTERLIEAGKVANTLFKHKTLFNDAKPFDSNISILYSLDSQLSDAWSPVGDYTGRSQNSQIVSVLGYYKALTEMGIQPDIKEIEGFDWESDEKNRFVIVPHITVLPFEIIEKMEEYVKKGNTLLISGFSGMYDEWTNAAFTKKSPMENLVGGRMKDYVFVKETFDVTIDNILMKAHLWKGEIDNDKGTIIAAENKKVLATINNVGKGKVIWIPSLLGIAAFQEESNPLTKLLSIYANQQVKEVPIKFSEPYKNAVIRLMENNDEYLSVICNDSYDSQAFKIQTEEGLKPEIIWGNANNITGSTINLQGKETIVIKWTY